MELAFLILVIGVVFWLNKPSIDKNKIKIIAKSIDKELNKEFDKRDKKIKELEERIKHMENILAEKGLLN